jgi:predicted component of type VI protein secretion system
MAFQLVVVKGRSATQAVPVPNGAALTVGRQDGCQLRIVSSLVSRKHCELRNEQGKLVVRDLQSSNGTYLDGLKIDGQAEVQPGQLLTIGNVVFRVETEKSLAAAAAAPLKPGARPGDTAVAHAVAVAQEEELDFEIEAEDITTLAPAVGRPPVARPPSSPMLEPDTASEDAPIELGEDDVAGFLLDIDTDPKDKR